MSLNEKSKKFLSAREIQIMKLVMQGCRNNEIANILSISLKTVENHMSNILRKLQARNRTEAVVIAIKFKLLDSSF